MKELSELTELTELSELTLLHGVVAVTELMTLLTDLFNILRLHMHCVYIFTWALFCVKMQQCYKYPLTPLSEHKVMCTVHGPFFARLWYSN